MDKIKVNTRYNQDRIENSVSFDNEEREYARNVIELQEKQTRAALIDLGWMPPEDAKSLTSKLDIEHRRRVAAENRKCNTCEHYIRESNKTIKGCGYLPNGKSPKKWFCADYKSIIKEAGE